MLLVLPAAATAAPTVVSLTFDDGQQTQYQVRPILAARGMHATFYVNSALSAASTTSDFRMPWSRLEDLARDGNEIAGHTLTHARLTNLTEAQQRTEICDDRTNLISHGFFPVASFAYPYAAYNATSEAVAQSCGYSSARKVAGIRDANCTLCPFAETIPPRDPYATRTVEAVSSTTTLASMQNSVMEAENNGGGWVQFVFHVICDACSNSDATSPAQLAALLDWLQPRAAAGTTVKTVAEVMGAGPSGFTVPGGGTVATNLFKNASLETADADMTPSCWLHGGIGTSTYSWTRTSDARSGSWAQKLDITSAADGSNRKLVSQQDSGLCAPSAVPGHTYRLSGYYKSTAPVYLVVFYRDIAGAWIFQHVSDSFPASSTWTQRRSRRPRCPPGRPPSAPASTCGPSAATRWTTSA